MKKGIKMKKRIIITLGLVAVLLITATSCEDYLYKQPRLSQTTELTLSTFEGLVAATAGAYAPLYCTNWYGRDFVVLADLSGGNAKSSPLNSGRYRTTYLWNHTPDDTYGGFWARGYNVIAYANNVIEVIEGGFEETGVEQEEIDALDGQCKALRALAYFDLARVFCQPYSAGRDQLGLPIVLVTENGKPARNTLGEVYDQIVADLEDAVTKVPETPTFGGNDEAGWFTNNAVEALLARVNLYMENWQAAADYATDVIDDFDGRLYTAAEYTTWDNGGAWGTDNGVEVIMEIYGDEGNEYHGNWDVISYIMNPDGYGDVGASKDVINLYEDGDVRGALFINSADFPNDFWSLKYPGKEPTGNLREDNIPIIRLSEMYLIRAEALLNGASVAGATAVGDVNAIRSNRGASTLGDITLNELYLERRRELCYEGHERFDLARTGRGLTRADYDGAVNQNIPFPDYRWAMPIPQAEIDANASMEQNPDY
jgi:hypothetical protein